MAWYTPSGRHRQEKTMRYALMSLATALAVLAFGVPSSNAQFFSKRYCTFGGGEQSSGQPDCSYNTWEQCRASASGLARFCGENPYYAESKRGDDRQGADPKRKGQATRNN